MQKSIPIKRLAAQQIASAIKAVNEATANFQLVASLVLESMDIGSAKVVSVDTDKGLLNLEIEEGIEQ